MDSSTFKLTARSPLAAHYQPGTFGNPDDQPLRLLERTDLTLVQISVWPDTHTEVNKLLNQHIKLMLPGVGSSSDNDHAVALWTGRHQYLIVSDPSNLYQTLSVIIPSTLGSVLELSSSRCVIRLSGSRANALLNKGLPVDLAPRQCPIGKVILSSFDKHFPAIVHKLNDDPLSYDIFVASSLAVSFWEWLTQAADEFGYENG